MKHIIAFIIKFIMITAVLEITLGLLTSLSFTQILTISLTVTVVAYLLGDLLILPISNNTVATLADAGLALFTILLFNNALGGRFISFTDALIAVVVIGVGEWIFHKFVSKSILPSK